MTILTAKRALARAWFVVALLTNLALGAAPVHAQGQGLAAAGPKLASGFPSYFQDRQGLALEPCLVQPTTTVPVPDPCALTGTLPLGDAAPIVFPTNFPDEFFWMRATSRIDGIGGLSTARADLILALEGAFAGAVADGQQIVFARFRLRVDNLIAGQTYKVIYPYGEQTFQAVVAPQNGNMINFTDDQGCLAVPCGTFDAVLNSTNVGPFVQWDPNVLPLAPPGFIGDPAIPHAITGSTFADNNKFRLEGPNVGGPGVNFIETPLFTIIGKKFTGVVPPPLTINRATYVRSSATDAQINVFAQSTGTATLVASGAGIPNTTLTADPATGRFFAPIVPNTPSSLPGFIRVTASALGAPDTVLDKALIDEVAVTQATFDENTNTLTIQATSSDQLAPAPTLEARDSIGPLGVLSAGTLTHAMPVPAAQVTVNSSAGGVATLPVSLVKRSPVATTTTLTASANPVFVNQAVTLTATVSAVSGTTAPNGTVTFLDGAATLGTGTLNASGVATLVVPAGSFAAGTHSITAAYAGVASVFLGSTSAPVSLAVNQIATTTVLTASANPIASNQAVALTATVSAGGPIPAGPVTFVDGTTQLGTVTLNASGVATLTVPANTFNVATHPITAVYAGNATFIGSSSAVLNLGVTAPNLIATTTTVTASANPILANQSVTLTFRVAAVAGTAIPTGSILVDDLNSTVGGTLTLNAQGVATLTVAANILSAGTHRFVATYAGNTTFGGSSGQIDLVVNPGPTATTTSSITATPVVTQLGGPGIRRSSQNTLVVTVSSTAGVPSGTVTFRDGTTTLGTATLNAAGVATLVVPANTIPLPATVLIGSVHPMTATYNGSATHATSSSTTNVRIYP